VAFDLGALVARMTVEGAQQFNQAIDSGGAAMGRAAREGENFSRGIGSAAAGALSFTTVVRGSHAELAAMAIGTRAAMSEVGTAVAAAGAATVIATGLTTKAAADWESAWAGVTKTVDENTDVVGGSYAEIEDGLRRLTALLPAAHTQIAGVAEVSGQLGIESENIVAFTRTMIDLGETTNLSANMAATELARFMNVMDTSQDRVSNVGSAVVELGNNFATTEAEIVSMAQRLSGASAIVKLTEGQTLGLAAALSSVGIESEAGGTAFSKIMIEIAASVETGSDKLEDFARVSGLSSEEFARKWRTDPAAALASFVTGLSGMEAQGESTFGVLEKLGITEVRMRDALLRSSAAAGQFSEAMETGNRAFDENIALQEEAAKRYATTESQVRIAGNAINDMAIELGEHLLPYVREGAEAVAGFAKFVGGLPEPVQAGAVGLGLITAAALLLGGTLLLAIPRVVAFRASLATLRQDLPLTAAALGRVGAFLTGPWGVALAVGGAALGVFQGWLESTKPKTDELTAAMTATDATAESMLATFNKGGWNEVFPGLRTELGDIQKVIDGIAGGADGIANVNADVGLSATVDRLKQIGEELSTLAAIDGPAAAEAFQKLAAATDGTDASILGLLDTMPAYKSTLIAAATAGGDYLETMSESEKQSVLLRYATEDQADSTDAAAAAYLAAADEAEGLRQTLDQLLETLNKSNDAGQDAITTNIDYQNALRDVDEAIAAARAGQEGYALTLDVTTEAGAANMSMLVDLAKNAWDAAEAQLALDGDTDKYMATLEASRQALIDRARDYGYNAEEAARLADQILRIPTKQEAELIVTANTSQAQRELNKIIELVGKVPTNWRPSSFSYGADGAVRGSTVTYMADGDMRPMSQQHAQMRQAGSYVVWAEDETDGETFLPHALGKRGRSEQLLAATAALFGGTYIPAARHMADGGMSSGPTLAPTATLEGMRITGTLDLGDGLVGFLDGRVASALDIEAQARTRGKRV
jgi:TP901 family phage tail tape measure protein